ncbi:MAG: DNA recombination protein RmuC [Patescibacteria group bacterium]
MSMTDILLVVGAVLLVGTAFALFAVLRQLKAQPSAVDPQLLQFMHERLESLDRDLRQSLTENSRTQQTASHHMTGAVRDVTERLVKIEETNKQVLEFSGQLDQLQRILTNPKQRGIWGEYYL